MAEYVVPRPAELRAGRVVIMIRALDPNAIRQMSVPSLVIEGVPRGPWQDNAAVTRFLDHARARLVSRLQDQRELSLQNDEFHYYTTETTGQNRRLPDGERRNILGR